MSIFRPRLTHWDCPHEPATAVMAVGSAFSLFQQRQEHRARENAREKAEERQEAQQSAQAREQQQALTENESQQRALRAARRVGRRGGSRRQLLFSGGNRSRVSSTDNLAST